MALSKRVPSGGVDAANYQGALQFKVVAADDVDALIQLWQQPHIVRNLLGEETASVQQLRAYFNNAVERTADPSSGYRFYAMTSHGKIIATRSILLKRDQEAHVVWFHNLCVDQAYLGQGIGVKWYVVLTGIVKNKHPHIKLIMLDQYSDNLPAVRLADRVKYERVVHYPDWLPRKNGQGKLIWPSGLIIRRYSLFKEPPVIRQGLACAKAFQPMLPLLSMPKTISSKYKYVNKSENGTMSLIVLDEENKKVANIDMRKNGNSHIAYSCSIIIGNEYIDNNKVFKRVIPPFLAWLLMQLSFMNIKVIALNGYHACVIDIARQLGFHCRGVVQAALSVDGIMYYNQVHADLSFYSIEDVLNILPNIGLDKFKYSRIVSALKVCQEDINIAVLSREIDQYMTLYLSNMVYQMTKETLCERHYYTADASPWGELIRQLPPSLKSSFQRLANTLGIMTPTYSQDDIDLLPTQQRPYLQWV